MSDERKDRIVSLVDEFGYMSIDDLCRRLGASQATMRTDLSALDKEGRLNRLRGVAISKRYDGVTNEDVDNSRAFLAKDYMVREKKVIAGLCLKLLSHRDTIFLDTSNTNYYVAERLVANTGMPLTVLTNSLDILQVLRHSHHITVVLSGGDYEASTNSLVGDHANRFIQGFYANYAFITARGFSPDTGVSAYYSRNTEIKKAMMNHAEKIVIVSDNSKFDNVGVELICPWSDVDYLVTNQEPPSKYHDVLRDNQITLIAPE